MRLLTSRSIPASTTISKLAEIFKVNSNYFYQDFDETNIFRYITSEFSSKYSFENLLANKIHNHALFISNKMLLDALIESTANISEKMKEVIYDYRNGTQSYDAIIENTEIAISNLSTLLTSLKAGKNIDN